MKARFESEIVLQRLSADLRKSSWPCGKFENNLMFPKSGRWARYSKPATANLGSFRKLRCLILSPLHCGAVPKTKERGGCKVQFQKSTVGKSTVKSVKLTHTVNS